MQRFWTALGPQVEQGQLPVQIPLSPAQILNVSALIYACVCVCVLLMYAYVPEYTRVDAHTCGFPWRVASRAFISLISSFETGFLPSPLLLPQFWGYRLTALP